MNKDDATLALNPAIIVIFGVTGDLARRKLLPSLYELQQSGHLHEKTRILGVIRREYELSALLQDTRDSITAKGLQIDEAAFAALASKLELYSMNPAQPEGYPELKSYLETIETEAGVCMSRLYYLAIPPQISAPVITYLGQNGLNTGCDEHNVPARLLLEKPFGHDVATAEELIAVTRRYFSEEQLYRIDHYLAKETVQNLATFRFRNSIFESLWNNQHITSITIAADEKLDIEGRANFYEQVGALRDLVQSHLMNVLAVAMMDRPADLANSDDIHRERQKVLDSIEPVPSHQMTDRVVRGQYAGYKDEVDNQASSVETFVALKLYSRLEQWQDVPIYVRTGKALARKQTSVTVEFASREGADSQTNQLVFSIQPNESITMQLWVKKPGYEREMQLAPMEFSYGDAFDEHGHPDAYERVLVDAMRGDTTLFATSEEVMASWRILQPVLDYWVAHDDDIVSYEKGSEGPDLQRLH